MFRLLCVTAVATASRNIDGIIKVIDREKLGLNMDVSMASLLSETTVSVLEKGREVSASHIDDFGKFSVPVADNGKYTLYFSHPTLELQPVVAVVDDDSVKGFRYDAIRTEESNEIPYPFVISPVSNNSPYVPEESFDALQVFKSPMVIMGLVMLVLVYVMPKLQGNMSPEEMQEMRRGMEEDGGFAANLLKSMIPAGSAGNSIPSLSSESRRRK